MKKFLLTIVAAGALAAGLGMAGSAPAAAAPAGARFCDQGDGAIAEPVGAFVDTNDDPGDGYDIDSCTLL